MTLAALSLCGPRQVLPRRTEVTDARTAKDPTGTLRVRAAMRRESDARWGALARSVRQALIEHDLIGMRGIGRLPFGSKVEGVEAWLESELDHKVFGYNGSWTGPYVQQAAVIAQNHAAQYVSGRVDPGRVADMRALAVAELRGIVGAAQQQLTRCVSHCLMAKTTPHKMANRCSGVIRMMRQRSRAMSEHTIVKTFNTCTLSAYRDAGVTHVGVIPERKSRHRIKQTAHGKVLVKDAYRKLGIDPHNPNPDGSDYHLMNAVDARRRLQDAPVGYTSALTGKKSSRIFKRKRFKPIEEVPSYEEVDVVTAGDNDVCPTCEEISDDGPYELDEAEDLIPAHPWCRCAFAPAGKYERDAFDPDEPRDPRGQWTSGGQSEGGAALREWFGESKVVNKNGHPLVVYHGTTAPEDFSEFSVGEQQLESSFGGHEYFRSGSGADPRTFLGSHFAEEPSVAGKFAKGLYGERQGESAGGRIYPIYLRIENPYKTTDSDMEDEMMYGKYDHPDIDARLEELGDIETTGDKYDHDPEYRGEVNRYAVLEGGRQDEPDYSLAQDMASSYRSKLQEQGYDGIKYKNEIEGGTSWIAFEPDQIKSALGSGFTKGKPRIKDYNPYHEPAGSPEGGRFASGGGFEGSSAAMEEDIPSPATDRVDALRKEIEASSGFGVRDFTPAQRQALDMYVYSSKRFNDDARAGVKTPEGDALESAINRYKTPRDLVVYRRIGWNDLNEKMKAHVGKDFTETGFMSTTMDEGMTFKPGSYMEIHVPKGVSGFPVGSLSNFVGAEDEAEVLFPRGSRMAVESVTPLRSPNSFKFVARMYAD